MWGSNREPITKHRLTNRVTDHAPPPYLDARVPLVTAGLRDVGELDDGAVAAGHQHQPGHGGRGLHAVGPVGRGQQGGAGDLGPHRVDDVVWGGERS